jgi:uncharacterized membrane protein YphA (DoxX/SURF4 family)
MDVVFLIGRILFALLFVMSGLMGHLVQARGTTEFARSVGAPAPAVMVPLTGVVILVGGLSVALGIWADLGALLLVAFLVPVAFLMHAFWKEEDPQAQQVQMAQFMKNIGLAGAALIIFYVYNELQGGAGLSLTEPLFARAD